MSKLTLEQYDPNFLELQKHFPRFLCGQHLHVRSQNIEELLRIKKTHLSVAMIGTRKPSPYGIRMVRELLSYWWKQPVCIVSGGALGIDGEAHRMALELGLCTRAWLVGPLESPSPQAHSTLFKKIENSAGSGLIVPEALEPSCGHKILPQSWLERNHWVAADADVMIVVEADLNSGTWHTVQAFNDLGRELWVVPGPVGAPRSRGTNLMISRGYANMITDSKELTQSLVVHALKDSYNI